MQRSAVLRLTLCAFLLAALCGPVFARETFGFLGDSITANYGLPLDANGNGNAIGAFLATVNPQATAVNMGRNGFTSNAWLPYYENYRQAVASFHAAGVHTVFIDLGVNDAKATSPAPAWQYQEYMSTICNSLISDGFDRVVLNSPTFVDYTRTTEWDSTSNVLIAQYGVSLSRIADNQHIFLGDRITPGFFQANPQDLIDGVHPDAEAAVTLGRNWGAAYNAIVVPETGTGVYGCLALASLMIAANRRQQWNARKTSFEFFK